MIRNESEVKQLFQELEEGTLIVVSQVMATHLADVRNDLVFPNELVRDAQGQPKGCRSLGRP